MNNMSTKICNDQIVKLTVSQLSSNNAKDLEIVSEGIKKAFGINGIGLLLVSELSSSFEQDRNDLLSSGRKLGQLPKEQLAKLECANIDYVIGWGRGHESFGGKIDMNKGSFYANPAHDDPSLGDNTLYEKYPHYMHPNCWPQMSSCKKLETSFKRLGSYMQQLAVLVAQHCDRYVRQCVDNHVEFHSIAQSIQLARCPRGRLLHYYPSNQLKITEHEQLWCGYHNDVGLLTALLSAQFYEDDSNLSMPTLLDSTSGLYIENTNGDVIKVSIPNDCIAFQIGECAQITTGGILRATPHAVKMPSNINNLSRVTFALFLQPDPWQSINMPSNHLNQQNQTLYSSPLVPSLKHRYFDGDTFCDFATRTFKFYSK